MGWGAIAGPLVIVAAAFYHDAPPPVLTRHSFERGRDVTLQDAKRLSRAVMFRLAEVIKEHCVDFECLVRPAAQIDSMGLQHAYHEGLVVVTYRLLERLRHQRKKTIEDYTVIIDGKVHLPSAPFKYHSQAHAARDIWQVNAASVLAKEKQLAHMATLYHSDPRYAWIKNAGYPTAHHLKALKTYGPSCHHRKSSRLVR